MQRRHVGLGLGNVRVDGRDILVGGGGVLDDGGDMSVVLRAYSAGPDCWLYFARLVLVSLSPSYRKEVVISIIYKS